MVNDECFDLRCHFLFVVFCFVLLLLCVFFLFFVVFCFVFFPLHRKFLTAFKGD